MFVLQTMIFRSKWSPGVVEILPVWNFHESDSYLPGCCKYQFYEYHFMKPMQTFALCYLIGEIRK